MQKIRDWMLMMVVVAMVAIDLVILVVYTLVEGFQNNFTISQVSHQENPVFTEGVSSNSVNFK